MALTNCFSLRANRRIRLGISADPNAVVLGRGLERTACIKVVQFDADNPPLHADGKIFSARPVRVASRTLLEATDLLPNGILVHIEASEVQRLNPEAYVIAEAERFGRRGTHRPPKCDTLVWLRDGGEVLVSFGSWKHRMVLTNHRGQLALERYFPYRRRA